MKYEITQEQIDDIEHYSRMFELNADIINGLCSKSHDEIVYGFELGKIHVHLRDCFIELKELVDEIKTNHQ